MGPTESRRDATEPAPRRLQTQAILAAVGSRVFVFLVAFAAGLLVGVNERPIGWRFPAQAEVFQGNLGHLLNPWAHWDGVWFIKIAARGYAADGGSTAFFPLLPSLLRYGGYLFGGNLVLTGIAGLTAAVGAARRWRVGLLTKSTLDDTTTFLAQGGIAAALGPYADRPMCRPLTATFTCMLAKGAYRYYVKAVDKAGNAATKIGNAALRVT